MIIFLLLTAAAYEAAVLAAAGRLVVADKIEMKTSVTK